MSFENISLYAAADALEQFAFYKRAAMSEVGYGGLIGAGAGAGLGLLHERFGADKRKKKNYLASLLAGGVAGGAVGAGAGALMSTGNTPASNDTSLRELAKNVDDARDSWNPFAYGPAKRELEAAGGKARNELDLMGSLTPSNGLLAPVNTAGIAGAAAGAAVPTLLHRRNARLPMSEEERKAARGLAESGHPMPDKLVRPKRPTAPKDPGPNASTDARDAFIGDSLAHDRDTVAYRAELAEHTNDRAARPGAVADINRLRGQTEIKAFREARKKIFKEKAHTMRNAGHSLVSAGAGYVTGSALDEIMRYLTHTDSK